MFTHVRDWCSRGNQSINQPQCSITDCKVIWSYLSSDASIVLMYSCDCNYTGSRASIAGQSVQDNALNNDFYHKLPIVIKEKTDHWSDVFGNVYLPITYSIFHIGMGKALRVSDNFVDCIPSTIIIGDYRNMTTYSVRVWFSFYRDCNSMAAEGDKKWWGAHLGGWRKRGVAGVDGEWKVVGAPAAPLQLIIISVTVFMAQLLPAVHTHPLWPSLSLPRGCSMEHFQSTPFLRIAICRCRCHAL